MEYKNKKANFKEFLDSSTNLITIFGIFNALTIYAATVNDRVIGIALGITFLLLSILVLWEIFIYTIREDNDSLKFKGFFLGILFSEICLVYQFFKTYQLFILLLTPYLGLFSIGMLLFWISIKGIAAVWIAYGRRFPNKYSEHHRQVLIYIYLLLIVIVTAGIGIFTIHKTRSHFQKLIIEKSNKYPLN